MYIVNQYSSCYHYNVMISTGEVHRPRTVFLPLQRDDDDGDVVVVSPPVALLNLKQLMEPHSYMRHHNNLVN